MKVNLWSSILSSIRQILDRFIWRQDRVETLYPKCPEDVIDIVNQAKDNHTQVKVTGGSFPTNSVKGDIHVNLKYMDHLLGLDVNQHTVIAEPGMRLSALSSLLDTVNLSLDLAGNIPDLAVVDALAIGVLGSHGGLCENLISVDVVTAQAELCSWTWSSHPSQMAALCSGLGLVAVVIAVTFKCLPLFRVKEISYLSSIRDVLESWSMVHRSSNSQRLVWFPFSEMVVLTHYSVLDRNTWCSNQSLVSQKMSELSLAISRFVRKINIVLFSGLPIFSSMLARVQFISIWSAVKHRSDYSHHPQDFCSSDLVRGSTWLLPLPSIPSLLYSISVWSASHSGCVSSPLEIQTVRGEPPSHTPFLLPALNDNQHHNIVATVWYDWFLPETSPDPVIVAQFEDLFHSAGGVRCWSGERIVSPMYISSTYPYYRKWCKVKKEMDPDAVLASGYVQGTVYVEGQGSANRSSERRREQQRKPAHHRRESGSRTPRSGRQSPRFGGGHSSYSLTGTVSTNTPSRSGQISPRSDYHADVSTSFHEHVDSRHGVSPGSRPDSMHSGILLAERPNSRHGGIYLPDNPIRSRRTSYQSEGSYNLDSISFHG